MVNLLFSSTISNPNECKVDGQDGDENILHVFRRSFITNLDWLFISVLLFSTPFVVNVIFIALGASASDLIPPFFAFTLNVFWYLFSFGFTFQNFLNWFFNLYVITDKRIIDIDFIGFLYKNISETSLDNIEDVTSTVNGALQIVFDYGDVKIQTAGQQREFEFESVSKPSKVRDIVADIIVIRRGDINN